jgi:hypothetical protein
MIESRAVVVNPVPILSCLPQHLLRVSENLTICTAEDTWRPRSRRTERLPESMISIETLSSVPEALTAVGAIHCLNEKLQRTVERIQ